jgi:ComF family protein
MLGRDGAFSCVRCHGDLENHRALCTRCSIRKPASLSALWAGARYQTPAMQCAVRLLKYRGAYRLALPLGAFLAECVLPSQARLVLDLRNAVVVSVPLAPRKKRQRGFNQAALLAAAFAERCKLPHIADAVAKARKTPSQVEMLTRAARRINLRGAFVVRLPDDIRGKTVLLIDDVITTGATMSEVAATLRRAGAIRVIGIALAKSETKGYNSDE